jgi:ATP-dependent DNA helicase DinG
MAPLWVDTISPELDDIAHTIRDAVAAIGAVCELFDDIELEQGEVQPILDLGRARRRLAGHASIASAMLDDDADTCRWIDRARTRRGPPSAALHLAPIDVAPTLRQILWEELPGTVATSATLTVAKRFRYWLDTAGLESATEALFPSPFNHREQALLVLPRDLPVPDSPDWTHRTGECLIDAVRITGGGAFVLCTSYAAVRAFSSALRDALGPTWPVLEQTVMGGRATLLQRFREDPRSVLVGTDSFWEGVSVKGEALRLIVIPKLPFRVPTEPLQQARYERAAARGLDPFRAFALPHAVLRLRQGYGRLLRSPTDHGAVLILDRRIHERSYGRVILASLPPATRSVGPWRRVREVLAARFSATEHP